VGERLIRSRSDCRPRELAGANEIRRVERAEEKREPDLCDREHRRDFRIGRRLGLRGIEHRERLLDVAHLADRDVARADRRASDR